MKRRRIAYIGSSYKFVHQSIRDYILTGCMDDTEVVLYDINPDPLKIEYDVIARMIGDELGAVQRTPASGRMREALF